MELQDFGRSFSAASGIFADADPNQPGQQIDTIGMAKSAISAASYFAPPGVGFAIRAGVSMGEKLMKGRLPSVSDGMQLVGGQNGIVGSALKNVWDDVDTPKTAAPALQPKTPAPAYAPQAPGTRH
jgi:hypothetical protein